MSLRTHTILNTDRFDTYRNVKSGVRDNIEQVRHKYDLIDLDETALCRRRAQWRVGLNIDNLDMPRERARPQARGSPKIP